LFTATVFQINLTIENDHVYKAYQLIISELKKNWSLALFEHTL